MSVFFSFLFNPNFFDRAIRSLTFVDFFGWMMTSISMPSVKFWLSTTLFGRIIPKEFPHFLTLTFIFSMSYTCIISI